MPKSKTRAEILFGPERPDEVGAHVTLESLGLTPDDPVNPYVFSAFIRRQAKGADLLDLEVQEECVAAGREAYRAARELEATRVVYYVKVGRYIKIGTALNLQERLKAYPPDAKLLATEPGHYETERKRLLEFSEYLMARREWFRPGPRLMEHIKALRRAQLDVA